MKPRTAGIYLDAAYDRPRSRGRGERRSAPVSDRRCGAEAVSGSVARNQTRPVRDRREFRRRRVRLCVEAHRACGREGLRADPRRPPDRRVPPLPKSGSRFRESIEAEAVQMCRRWTTERNHSALPRSQRLVCRPSGPSSRRLGYGRFHAGRRRSGRMFVRPGPVQLITSVPVIETWANVLRRHFGYTADAAGAKAWILQEYAESGPLGLHPQIVLGSRYGAVCYRGSGSGGGPRPPPVREQG